MSDNAVSDNLKRYFAIQQALLQRLPSPPTGNRLRHINTLAALISGIVGSRHVHLPAVASKVPNSTSPHQGKRDSRHKRFERWIRNERHTEQAFYLPYALALVASLPPGPLALVMDGSQVGRGCMALVISVVYQKRALPLCWCVVKAKKGHFAQEAHVALLHKAQALIPKCRQVVFLGDGEFDGTDLLGAVLAGGWHYVCRTGTNASFCEDDRQEADDWFTPADLPLQRGEQTEIADLLFTRSGFGPVLLGAVWQSDHQEPLYLVSSLDFLTEALGWYRKRFRIETFFSDQKSRGFQLSKSHLSDPGRLSRLMIATCLGYLWLVCLGVCVVASHQLRQVHRRGRCDLSLFQIGLVWLEHCLNEGLPVLVPLSLEQSAASQT